MSVASSSSLLRDPSHTPVHAQHARTPYTPQQPQLRPVRSFGGSTPKQDTRSSPSTSQPSGSSPSRSHSASAGSGTSKPNPTRSRVPSSESPTNAPANNVKRKPVPNPSSSHSPESRQATRPSTAPSLSAPSTPHTFKQSNANLNTNSHRSRTSPTSSPTAHSPLTSAQPPSQVRSSSSKYTPSRSPSSHNPHNLSTGYGSSSGNASDSALSIDIDMKRLLSKPALPSGSSMRSGGISDPEIAHKSSPGPRKDTAEHRATPSTLAPDFGASLTPLNTRSSSHNGSSRESSAHSRGAERPPPKTRNVLRRRSSVTKGAPAAPLFSNPFAAGTPAGKREHTRRAPPSPSALTPAGAVAQAYKQQEKRREDLVREDELEEAATPYYTVLGSTSGKIVAVGGPEDDSWNLNLDAYLADERAARARLASVKSTVSSEKTEKKSLSRKVSGKWKKVAGSKEDNVGPVVESEALTFLRGRPSMQHERSSDSTGREKGARGKRTAAETNRRSLRLSIEKFPDAPMEEMPRMRRDRSASDKLPVPLSAASETWTGDVPHVKQRSEPSHGSTGSKLWKLMKRISTGGLKEKYHESAPPPVPALPKGYLVKSGPRSADGHGGIHDDNPHEGNGVVLKFMQSRTSMSAACATEHKPSPRTMRSPSTKVPSTAPPHPAPSSANTSGPRPSTTTRSSSPVSSDVASSKFFHRPHSTRSSTSSYGDEIPPPVPKMLVGQHILPPSELYRYNGDIEKASPSTSRSSPKSSQANYWSSSTPASPEEWILPSEEFPALSLPFPPRYARSRNDADSLSSGRSSPVIPSFSTESAINTFGVRKPGVAGLTEMGADARARPTLAVVMPASEFGASRAPPRPSRSAMRPAPGSAPRAATTPAPGSSAPSFDRQALDDMPTRNRQSSGGHSNASTARPARRSSSLNSIRRASLHNAPLTYRELGDAEINRQLTEQEKADRWDDLLERSARAGGTLHLGGAGLLSDDLRFSTISSSTFMDI